MRLKELRLDRGIAYWQGSRIHVLKHSATTLGKFFRWRDQTKDEIAVGFEVVEMSGMCQHRFLPYQFNREIFIGTGNRDPEHGIPTCFEMKALAQFLRCELAIEFG